ncbi:uncharacterized protein LOC132166374 [Corylus avellana]|uniref:uncharacterized protein LOC132166374 n=1 Tax=Corylus avellana TaxID=13451 RepID=UPI00286B4FAE|nr:uncharacterized protein LOC132166374 [Corylus avellana]
MGSGRIWGSCRRFVPVDLYIYMKLDSFSAFMGSELGFFYFTWFLYWVSSILSDFLEFSNSSIVVLSTQQGHLVMSDGVSMKEWERLDDWINVAMEFPAMKKKGMMSKKKRFGKKSSVFDPIP